MAYAGDWLKSEQGWGGFEGSNRLHFGALPEGYLDLDGTHRQEGEYAYFWSSDSVETSLLNSNNNSKSSWYFTKSIEAVHQENNEQLGLAVRCVKSK